MKSVRCVSLLALIGAAVGLGTYAIGQQTDVRPTIRPVRVERALPSPTKPPAARFNVQQLVKQNPTLLPFLLREMNDSDENDIQKLVGYALAGLTPGAVDELIKVIEGNDASIRGSAIGILTSSAIPQSEINRLVPILLRIAQDESEEEIIRKTAKTAMCVLIVRVAPVKPIEPTQLPTY